MKRLIILFLLIPQILFAGTQQQSNTTAAEIIEQARAYLNSDTSADTFLSETEMLQWLNDGTLDIVERSHCLQDTEEINLVAGQLEYTITTDYVFVKTIHYVNSSDKRKGLQEGRPANVGHSGEIKTPKYWYDWKGKVGIFPVLNSATTEKIILYIVPKPSEITINQTVPTPGIYDSALVKYIIAQAWVKDRQSGKYNQAMAVYIDELNRLKREFVKSPGDKK